MLFTVKFITGGLGDLYDVYNPGKGLDLVEEVRGILKKPALPAELIDTPYCNINSGCYEINLKGQHADVLDAAVTHFKVKRELVVVVPPGWLSRFMQLVVTPAWNIDHMHSTYTPTRLSAIRAIVGWCVIWPFRSLGRTLGGIKRVKTNHEINDALLLREWVAAGCPTYWGTTEKAVKFKLAKIAEETRLAEATKEKERERRKQEYEAENAEAHAKAEKLRQQQEQKASLDTLKGLIEHLNGIVAYFNAHYLQPDLQKAEGDITDEQ